MALFALWLAALGLVRGLRRFFPRGLPYVYRQGLANLYRPANQTLMVVLALGFGAFLLSTLLLVQHNLLRELRVDRGAARPNLVFFDVQPDQRDDVAAARRRGGAAHRRRWCRSCRCGSTRSRAAPVSELLAIEDDDAAARALGAAARVPQQLPRRADELRAHRGGSLVAPGRVARRGRRAAADRGRGRPRARAEARGRRRRGLGRAGSPESLRASPACARWSGRASSPTSSWCFPRARSTARRRATCCSRASRTPRRARGCSARVVEAHPNVSTLDLAQVQRSIEGVLDKVLLAVRFMALFSLAAGAVVLAGAVAASRYQRVREGALLRTLGARRAQLVRILLAEYAVLGTLSVLAAVLLSSLAGWALVRFVFDGRFALPLFELALLLVSVLALTVAVGLAGSTEVWRRPPLEVLRAE